MARIASIAHRIGQDGVYLAAIFLCEGYAVYGIKLCGSLLDPAEAAVGKTGFVRHVFRLSGPPASNALSEELETAYREYSALHVATQKLSGDSVPCVT